MPLTLKCDTCGYSYNDDAERGLVKEDMAIWTFFEPEGGEVISAICPDCAALLSTAMKRGGSHA